MHRVIENGLMSIDTRRDTFNMQDIENRRFMYNPETGVLLLGVQAPVNKYFSSHAEEHAKSGDLTHFDKFVRGWVGVGGKYKDGVIHFAPPVPHYYPSLFDKGFDALEMFNNNNANGKTVVRGFGKRWEQPLADILLNHKEVQKMADDKAKQDVLYDAQAPVMTAAPPDTAKAAPEKSYAEKQIEKMKELTDRLEQGVKDLLASDKYKDYLAVMSKFHNYSFRNSILIFLQKPDASMVAGYGAWQKNFKRQVKRGEKGIKIIAPAPYKTERDMPIMQNEESKNKLTVLVVPPMQKPFVKEIDAGLESLQKEVGGLIEVVYPFEDRVGIICNEDGKFNGMELNRALYTDNGKMYDIIAGTFLVAGLSDEDFTSLTAEQTDKFSKRFQTPETFMRFNGEIVAVPIKPSIKNKLKQPTSKGQDQAKPPRKPPNIEL